VSYYYIVISIRHVRLSDSHVFYNEHIVYPIRNFHKFLNDKYMESLIGLDGENCLYIHLMSL